MRAQVTLLPTESKKLIAKAVAKMDVVQNAFSQGIVALHPSSSTIFIAEELLGKPPDTEIWVIGVVAPKGTCVSMELTAHLIQQAKKGNSSHPRGIATNRFTWVIERGELKIGMTLGELLDRMGPDDVYIKGVNAIDPYNNVGVLIGQLVGKILKTGTIGLVMDKRRSRGFKVVFPVGLEKLIPIPIKQAAKEAAATLRNLPDYSMGVPCGLLPCEGIVVTEPKAIEILAGATAIPISAGGLGGAEGAITMVIKGGEGQVTKAIDYIEEVKGAQLSREVRLRDCKDCVEKERCSLGGGNKPWC